MSRAQSQSVSVSLKSEHGARTEFLTVRSRARVQGVESPAAVSPKKHCGAGRKATSKAKSAPTVPTKDPQSLAAKVTSVFTETEAFFLHASFHCPACCYGDLSRPRSC